MIPVSYQKIKLYVLCGYDWEGTWKADFLAKEIFGTFSYGLPMNQPAQFRKKSLREFCTGQGEYSSCFRYLTAFEALHPEMAHYLDMKYEEVQYGKIYG